MTDSTDANDEGNPARVILDLSADAAYVITKALKDFANDARDWAEDLAGDDVPDPAGSLAAFNQAGLAEALRRQVQTQIDARSGPKTCSTRGGVTG